MAVIMLKVTSDLIGSLGGMRYIYRANNQQNHNVHNQDLSHNKFLVPPALLHDCPIEGEKE